MIRRFGKSPKHGQKYRRRAGIYAVCLDGNALLTTLQQAPHPEYQLPGGGIDPGEHPIAALHREVFEETGWRVQIQHRIGTYRRFTFMPEYELWAEKLCSVYLARPVMRLGAPTEPGHSAIWMPAAEGLILLGTEGDRAMLARVLGGAG